MTSVTSTGTGPRGWSRLPGGTAASRIVPPVALLVIGIGLWQLLVVSLDLPPYLLPAPSAVAEKFVASFPTIMSASLVTGTNALWGLIIGSVVGIVVALFAASVRVIDQLLFPLIAALAVVPIVALAPVLYIMFGAASETTRVVVAAIAVFVPVFVNTLRGLRQVRPVHRELMRALAISGWKEARTVNIPTAVPFVFTGLRIGSSLAVISALVAEYFGGPRTGIGSYITTAASGSNYALAWAFVLGAIITGLLFYVVTLVLELAFSRHRGR